MMSEPNGGPNDDSNGNRNNRPNFVNKLTLEEVLEYLNGLRRMPLPSMPSIPGLSHLPNLSSLPSMDPRYFQYLWNVVKVDLQIDVSMEDRLFLDNGAQPKVKSILDANRCQMKLNISASVGHPDNSPVVISGPPDGVRDSYLAIRLLLPITIWFDLHLNSVLSSLVLDPSTQPLQDIQKRYEMAVHVVPSQLPFITPTPMNHITVYIRTNRENEANLQPGIDALRDYIEANNLGHFERMVQTKIDVLSAANRLRPIVGQSYLQLEPIANKTFTQITVQKSGSNLNHSPNIAIAGHDYSAVSAARSEISDRFVVELNFEINANQSQVLEGFGRQLEGMGDQFGVHILMKPSANPNQRIVIVRGTDREVKSLFDVRNHILELIRKPRISPYNTLNNNNYN